MDNERIFATLEHHPEYGQQWKIEAEGIRDFTSVLPGPYIRTIGYVDTIDEIKREFPTAEIYEHCMENCPCRATHFGACNHN